MHRLLFIILAVVAAQGCGLRPAVNAAPPVRRVDFVCSAPAAASVAVAGSFNRWSPDRDLLKGPDSSGRWTGALWLPPGRYEYQFVIDGRTWLADPELPSVDDGLGGRNSLLIVE